MDSNVQIALLGLGGLMLFGAFILLIGGLAWLALRGRNGNGGPLQQAADGMAAMGAALGTNPVGNDAGSVYQRLPGGGIGTRRWNNMQGGVAGGQGAQIAPGVILVQPPQQPQGPQVLMLPAGGNNNQQNNNNGGGGNPPAPTPLTANLTTLRGNAPAAGGGTAAYNFSTAGLPAGTPLNFTFVGLPATVTARLVGAGGAAIASGTPIQAGQAYLVNIRPNAGAAAGNWAFQVQVTDGTQTASAGANLTLN